MHRNVPSKYSTADFQSSMEETKCYR